MNKTVPREGLMLITLNTHLGLGCRGRGGGSGGMTRRASWTYGGPLGKKRNKYG